MGGEIMPVDLGHMAFGTWTWGEVLPKTRDDTEYMYVEPCEKEDVHGAHLHSRLSCKGTEILVCAGVKPPEPTEYIMSQFMNPDIRRFLPCKMREGDGVTGYQCERLDDHEDGHWFSEHLIRHERAGNGYSCEQIEAM